MRGSTDTEFTFLVDDLMYMENSGLSYQRRISPYMFDYKWHSF